MNKCKCKQNNEALIECDIDQKTILIDWFSIADRLTEMDVPDEEIGAVCSYICNVIEQGLYIKKSDVPQEMQNLYNAKFNYGELLHLIGAVHQSIVFDDEHIEC